MTRGSGGLCQTQVSERHQATKNALLVANPRMHLHGIWTGIVQHVITGLCGPRSLFLQRAQL